MVPHSANGKYWFTAEGSKAVASFDPVTHQIDWCLGTGQDRTHMIYVTTDGKNIYTTNVSSGTVSLLIDTLLQPGNGPDGKPFQGTKPHWEWKQTVIQVSRGSEGFDVSPDGHELWTASAEDGTIAIIDIAARRLTGKIDAKAFGAKPAQVYTGWKNGHYR